MFSPSIFFRLDFSYTALDWHFTAVTYTLYKQIKAENEQHPGVAYHVGARDQYKV